MRIALLDEDIVEADLICRGLRAVGLACEHYGGAAALPDTDDPMRLDLLILAIRGDDAFAYCDPRRVGEPGRADLPMLLIADREAQDRIVEALGAGMTDYLLRPLRRPELLARVQVLLRRAYPDRQPARMVFGSYVFETESARLTMADRPVDVTQKEFHLALLFFRHLGRPLSRAFIRDRVWPGEADMPSRTLDKHVSRVRSKLRLSPEHGYRLAPVYSFGYRLECLDTP